MISRNRSAPTAAAMSIECTTSAKRTVTCLYSADWGSWTTGVPHSPQNLALAPNSVPHDPQGTLMTVWSVGGVDDQNVRLGPGRDLAGDREQPPEDGASRIQ